MRTVAVTLLAAFLAAGCGKKAPDGAKGNPSGQPSDTGTPDEPKQSNEPKKPGQPTETDEQKAQGVWKVVGVEMPPGDPAPPKEVFAKIRLAIQGNKVTVSAARRDGYDTYFTIKSTSTASPKTVDFLVSDEKGVPIPPRSRGPGRSSLGEHYLGIYKFEGDELVVAAAAESLPEGYRPTEFKAAATKGPEDGKQHYRVVVIRLTKADTGEKIVPNPPPKSPKTPSTRK